MSKGKGATPLLPAGDRSECVKVAVRCRPINDTEKGRGEKSIIQMEKKRGTVALLKDPSQPIAADGENNTGDNKLFTFDFVYPPGSPQMDIYNETAKPIVESVLNGYNGTIFAYGQTGTGKTFTMEGVPDNDSLRGIMPNSFLHIFDAVKSAASNIEFLVRASFLEIYLDEVYDLLNKNGDRLRMEVRESKDKGVFVEGLNEFVVKSSPDLLKVLKAGQKTRKVGATKMNEGSSRSHSLLMITVEASEKDPQGEVHYRVGKLNLVDLAGSERQKRTEATGERLDEAKAINLSLSALGNVIKALINPNSKHIPFRDSKLTRLLQDSLGGNTKTVMIANLGPAELSYDETLSTLRYANRAKNIKNKPKINEDPKDAMLREYQEEIQRLKQQLANRRVGLTQAGMIDGGTDIQYIEGQSIIEENVIVKEVVKETGITPEHVQKLKEKARIEEDLLKAKTEKEREKLRREKESVESAVQQYEEELKRRNDQLAAEKAEFEKLQTVIKEKESQLIQGEGELDRAAKKKEELQRAEDELRRKKDEEAKLAKDLEEAKEAQLLLVSHASSKEEEKASKSAKIKQLMKLYAQRKQELADQREEWEEEKNEIVESIRGLDRQLKLKQLIVQSFIPQPLSQLISSLAQWDELNQEWRIEGQELAGNNVDRLSKGNKFKSRIDQIVGENGESGYNGKGSSSDGALGNQLLSYQSYRQNLQMAASQGRK